ncbi:MAG: peptidase M75 [Bacteroidales bacterium]|nr:peptidase M75 [Bacteroidales bacterium]
MKFTLKNATLISMMAIAASVSFTACDDDEKNDNNNNSTWTAQDLAISAAGILDNYVDNVVVATYGDLKDDAKLLLDAAEALSTEPNATNMANVDKYWKAARQDWEYSEAFLFGAATDYSIDPHIDTWPFDQAKFNSLIEKYNPATNEEDADYIDGQIAEATLTGFHAIEYIIYSDGNTKDPSTLSADELYFCKAVAADLYLSAIKLYGYWAGEDALSKDEAEVAEEAEVEFTYNYGNEFKNAGNAGSRWKSPTEAIIQIIDGCNDIIGEVRDAKIGAAHNGEDVNYIESPFSHNSITDFYDNIISCAHALYGTNEITNVTSVDNLTASAKSLMTYAALTHSDKTGVVATKLANALVKIAAMKRPFVTYYADASAQEAMDALEELEDALDDLKSALEE